MLMALAAAMLWGSTGTAQSLLPSATSPLWVAALRLAGAALFFALLEHGRRWAGGGSAPAEPLLPVRALWPGIALAGGSMALYNLAFFAGVKASGVAVGTAVAIGSGPVWAGLLQWLWTRRAPEAFWWAGTLLAVAGGALLASSGGTSPAQGLSAHGLALCLTAGFSYALYTLICQQLVAAASPTLVTRWVFTVAAAVALPVALASGGQSVSGAMGWAVVVYLGVVTTGVAYLLFSHALRHIAAATGVTLALAEPVTAFLLAILVVNERPALPAYAGGALVLAGLLVVVWAERRRWRRSPGQAQ